MTFYDIHAFCMVVNPGGDFNVKNQNVFLQSKLSSFLNGYKYFHWATSKNSAISTIAAPHIINCNCRFDSECRLGPVFDMLVGFSIRFV